MDRYAAGLGEPDLSLAGFQLWVHGPDRVDARPFYSWLNATAHCGAGGASVWVTPDHLVQRHEFRFDIDQSYLPGLMAQGRRLLERIPTFIGTD